MDKHRHALRTAVDAMGQALEGMVGSLRSTVGAAGSAATVVGTGSRELMQASDIVSGGATRTAASTEEMAAALASITQQSRANLAQAESAAQLAAAATHAAGNGQAAMGRLTESLAELVRGAEDIERVVSAVDDIAFQTNILALNAAVEAARAGRHGKGFAVVAEEVRSLAGRSAKAAKETADMIRTSIARTSTCSTLASNAAGGLQAVVQQVRDNATQVNSIASASQAQVHTLSEVLAGLDQINGTIQATTASAEQSAATARELNQQAEQLTQALAVFRQDGASAARLGHRQA